jgi:hypothetical protein
VLIFSLFLIPCLHAQTPAQEAETPKKDVPKVYLDWPGSDLSFVQGEVNFVQFVSDPKDARVHVAVSIQKTPEGDEDYTLSFTGSEEFEGLKDTQKYLAKKTDKTEDIRKGVVHVLRLGLMRYVSKTPVAGRIEVDFLDKVKPTAVVDKWDFWVFSISANAFLNGEKYYKSGMFYGSLSANRVTPELKIRTSISGWYEKNKFIYETDSGEETVDSSSDSQSFQGMIVKSLNDHWSAGAYLAASSSTYNNIKLSLSPAPAVEYDFFPYSQSTKKQLRFLYRLNFISRRYREETIYFKTYENLWKESLSITLEVKEKWGTVSTSLEGSNYLHDFKKNRLELWGELSLRIFKGLNFNIHGSGSRIRDQLNLAKGAGASLEEVLLRRKQLATGYDYYFSVGLSYTFGSTSSQVVNPRFGDGGSSISIHF